MSAYILVIEDEKDLVDTIEYNLQQEGYNTRSALTGGTALEIAFHPPHPDVVLLDLMLPDIPGLDICRKLKSDERTRHIPVIVVTAKGEEVDRVVGFELGADDYVVKPFSVRELLLRIKAILRRVKPEEPLQPLAVYGRLRIDAAGYRVWVDDDEIRLTPIEFKVLETLATKKGRVQTREMLLSDVWGIEVDVTTRTVDTHIKRLREKLGSAGEYIETIRGVGYRFRLEADEHAD